MTPPDSPELRDRVTDLRRLGAEIRRVERSGRSARTLVARQAAVEASIRRQSRHAPEPGPPSVPTGRRKLVQALGDTALVEWSSSTVR